jgi:hypothetical protein
MRSPRDILSPSFSRSARKSIPRYATTSAGLPRERDVGLIHLSNGDRRLQAIHSLPNAANDLGAFATTVSIGLFLDPPQNFARQSDHLRNQVPFRFRHVLVTFAVLDGFDVLRVESITRAKVLRASISWEKRCRLRGNKRDCDPCYRAILSYQMLVYPDPISMPPCSALSRRGLEAPSMTLLQTAGRP